MEETARIKKLIADLYSGQPWLDVTIKNTLAHITPGQAFNKISPRWNSIWEILNHIIEWRKAVLLRVQGNTPESPADNYFRPVTDHSEAAWQDTLARLEGTQEAWITFMDQFNQADFEKTYPSNGSSYYDHIQGIIQHDAYHLGQIVLLAKGL